jgi:hypothetical protein
MKIEDGKGKNGDASVSSVQRLNVSAKNAPRAMYAGRDFGLSYSAVYHATAAAGEYVAYLKNTSSTRNMFVGDMTIGGVNSILWKMFFVAGTAASGELITPTPMNKSKNIPAEAIAMAGDTAITALTADGEFSAIRSPAADSIEENFDGTLILGPGDAIALEYDAGTSGICEVDIHFHYEDIGAS